MKVHIYASEAWVEDHSTRLDLHGLSEYAAQLARQSDRATLLGLAREVDQ